ncbi:MAG: bifunctional phosphoglucose/phosphomannose isomerase [Anaerolineales bacterium]
MNLNDPNLYKKIDTEGMIGHINGLPDQLAAAWKLGSALDLPAWSQIRQVVVSGMGGSAIGSDLLAAFAEPMLSAAWLTHRDYGLPAWARGEETLVICSSHSGNTEETLSAFEAARAAGCRVLAICTSGTLAAAAQDAKLPLWTFDHQAQPRTAVGFSFGLLLAAAARLGVIADPGAEVEDAVAAMKEQQQNLLPEIPDTANSAKRMGGQFMGRWVTVFGASLLAPVARRWKTQINENAKAQASFEFIPEANHNTLEGVQQPEEQFNATMDIFLRSSHNPARDERRAELTRMAFMLQGQNTDTLNAQGSTRLAHMWTALHYGDYASYYLALAYGVDPTPVPMLADFKEKMKGG